MLVFLVITIRRLLGVPVQAMCCPCVAIVVVSIVLLFLALLLLLLLFVCLFLCVRAHIFVPTNTQYTRNRFKP